MPLDSHVTTPERDVSEAEVTVSPTCSVSQPEHGGADAGLMQLISDEHDILNGPIVPVENETVPFPRSMNLTGLFLGHLRGAIRKMDQTSDLEVNFPIGAYELDGVVRVAIKPDQVTFIASRLFGVNIVRDKLQRYVIGENGVKIIPDSNLRIIGGAAGAIKESFGEEILAGIEESTIRKNERLHGISDTECLYMRISCNANDCAYLHIIMGLNGLFSVYTRCFPNYPQ
jgi:hypothetical protein